MALIHQIKRVDEPKPKTAGERLLSAAKDMRASVKPEAAAPSAKPRGRKPSGNAKKLLTLRLDADLIEHYRATGDGWQSRMNADLRKVAGL